MNAEKGGEIYVLGNAAGRPLINAVGKPKVVINGTCLDYLAESFMAGDPLNGGGFCVVNAMRFNHEGKIEELPTPYPGGNLMSLASGGAVYIRDPRRHVGEDQLNGGALTEVTEADRKAVGHVFEENERLFGISVEHSLLARQGSKLSWPQAYRKVIPAPNNHE